MIAELAVLAALVSSSRIRIAEVDVVGPVSGVVLDAGAPGESRFARAFAAGERLRVAAPVAVEDAGAPVVPAIRWTRDEQTDAGSGARGSVRFARWREDRAAESLAALPPGLLARPRPPLEAPAVRANRATLALLPACLVLGLAARRRRAIAAAVGVLGAAIVLALGWPRSDAAPSAASVLECDADSAAALEVSASFGRVTASLSELEGALLETGEERARLVWTEEPGGLESWTAAAPGTSIVLLRRIELGDQGFRRDGNAPVALAASWVREDGTWTARGPWPTGIPLPQAREGPPPPGWLQAGLPQGVSILLGREEDARGARFVRVSGF